MIDKTLFQTMITNGPCSGPIKGIQELVKIKRFDNPLIINSNYFPNYTEKYTEIVRRILVLIFKYIPKVIDSQLSEKIKNQEYSSIIHNCRMTYLDYCNKYKGQDIHNIVPKYFIETSNELKMSVNPFFNYISTFYSYNKNAFTPTKNLISNYKAYLTNKFGKEQNKVDISYEILLSLNPEFEKKSIHVCKFCLQKPNINKAKMKKCCKDYDENKRSKIVSNNCLYLDSEKLDG